MLLSVYRSTLLTAPDMSLEVESRAVTDRIDENLELDKYSKDYVEAWAIKCSRNSYQPGTRVRDTVDLDGHGQKFVAAFMESAEECAAKGKMLPHDYLGFIILIMRNDIVHQYSHVSRSAYQCLLKYLSLHQYAVVSKGQDGGYGEVVICPEAAWLPFFKDLTSFFPKYLMWDDMSLSGKQFAQDELGLQINKRMSNGTKIPEKWRHADEMLLHCVNCALEWDEKDFNGDLLMFDYFVRVLSQDLECRLQVIHSILHDERGVSNQSQYFTQMKSLLENSGLWRMFIGMKWDPKISQKIVFGLVQLIVESKMADDDAMEYAEEEPEDDAPAGACAFSRADLSNIAAQFLNKVLDMFGTMEKLGGFLATSSYRAAMVNYRMALDEFLVESFWTEKGVCKDIHSSSKLLYMLHPRDALRLVGLVTATKFTRTFSTEDIQKIGDGKLEDVQELYRVMEVISTGSKDIDTFFEIDVLAILQSFLIDISKSIKIYKTADHLALLVGVIGASLNKLILMRQDVPVGKNDIKKAQELVKACIDAIYDHESGTNNATRLSNHGSIFLSVANIFVKT